ncbi:hypothetical protein BWQ96_07320 [Gracilariopsis chorda]|uniref:Uncharacterized protein n=1 Tax=Gracilariopsis chorda TaxID=448386 RepID=A0A2V3ILH8_9FLOR|nr:hypothetical protein BWQ96_07320 [Gracilariopsis chorda]|eukprot:PXF42942.1 hypothetical protein BWQ96_07320 [Gracilariopsis chorda]
MFRWGAAEFDLKYIGGLKKAILHILEEKPGKNKVTGTIENQAAPRKTRNKGTPHPKASGTR